MGNSFINDTFLTLDECVQDLDLNYLFCSTLVFFFLIQSNWKNALKDTYFISSE